MLRRFLAAFCTVTMIQALAPTMMTKGIIVPKTSWYPEDRTSTNGACGNEVIMLSAPGITET
jgi:hypothetical protein